MSDADRTATGISVMTSQPDTLTPANILEREIYQSALAIRPVLSSKSTTGDRAMDNQDHKDFEDFMREQNL